MWKTYSKRPRRFKVVVDSLTFEDHIYCDENELSETIENFDKKYKMGKFTELKVYEILNIEWEEN